MVCMDLIVLKLIPVAMHPKNKIILYAFLQKKKHMTRQALYKHKVFFKFFLNCSAIINMLLEITATDNNYCPHLEELCFVENICKP